MEELSDVTVALALLIVVAVMIERTLAFLFDAKPIRALVSGNGPLAIAKPWIALAVSALVVFQFEIDLIEVMYSDPGAGSDNGAGSGSDPTLLGLLLTSFMVAGGSAGLITLFQDVLGWSKGAREARRAIRDAATRTATLGSGGASRRGNSTPKQKPSGKVGFTPAGHLGL